INVAGLSLGIFAVVAIFIYISDELSYDRFHTKANSIYRINTITHFDGNENSYSTTSAPLGENAMPSIEALDGIVRLFSRQASIQLIDGKTPSSTGQKFREEHFFLSDPSIFKIFSFAFIKGSPESALQNPSSLVLSREIAEKYFGSVEAAMGRDFLFEGHRTLTVSGVIENYPHQSHLAIKMLAHFDHYYMEETPETQEYLRTDWLYNPVLTYVLLKPDRNPKDVGRELNKLKNRLADERVVKGVTFSLQPLLDIHLHSNFSFSEQASNMQDIYIMSSIGLLILLLACINFVNLSNVHSLKRAKEIGVRKVLGAQKKSLMIQFLSESSALVLFSFALSFGFLIACLPVINEITTKHFTLQDLFSGDLMLGLYMLFLLTAFLAGLYPSFYVTRFRPAVVLKGLQGHRHTEGFLLRKTLIVFQFTVSITLVVMGIIFYQQMDFVKRKPLGFQRDHMLTIPLFSDTPNSILGGGVDGPLRSRMNAFETEVLANADIEAISLSSALPGAGAVNALVQTKEIKPDDNVFIAVTAVDYDFLETYKMELIHGRNFSKEFGTDHEQAFIINEQAVKMLGWNNPAEAVGQSIELLSKQGSVIGVVKDFHFQGLQQPLRPLILEVSAGKFTVFSIRLNATNVPDAIDWVKQKWDNAFPEMVFEYHFFDDRLDLNYGREQRMMILMKYFSILAIFISALGLFGLAAYINHLREKEVSIRKVLGARAGEIFYVLSKDFLKMAAVAFLIAAPASYIFVTVWLGSFSYKVAISAIPFLIGGALMLITVLLTITYETMKSVNLNPIEKLRNE
ncbi:MAG TPA: ABC transporter permease, partial [Chryseolinea sp.]|nr:ABC transporter permease [Chryseolinea sp.]